MLVFADYACYDLVFGSLGWVVRWLICLLVVTGLFRGLVLVLVVFCGLWGLVAAVILLCVV